MASGTESCGGPRGVVGQEKPGAGPVQAPSHTLGTRVRTRGKVEGMGAPGLSQCVLCRGGLGSAPAPESSGRKLPPSLVSMVWIPVGARTPLRPRRRFHLAAVREHDAIANLGTL